MGSNDVSECTSYTPPMPDEFPDGYCVWQDSKDGIPVLVGAYCVGDNQCGDASGVLQFLSQMESRFDGACYNVACKRPVTTGAAQQAQAAYDPDDQEGA